jgi:hypothetical protein
MDGAPPLPPPNLTAEEQMDLLTKCVPLVDVFSRRVLPALPTVACASRLDAIVMFHHCQQ